MPTLQNGLEFHLQEIPHDTGTSKFVRVDFFRPLVVVEICGINVPFYVTSGRGGKKSVPSGKWYPIMGICEKTGWFNKGNSEQAIQEYFGIDTFKNIAKYLDDTYGNMDDKEMPLVGTEGMSKNYLSVVNRDLKPSSPIDPNADQVFENNLNLIRAMENTLKISANDKFATPDERILGHEKFQILPNEDEDAAPPLATERPGLTIISNAQDAEEKQKPVKPPPYDVLSWETLIEQLKALYAETEFPKAELIEFKNAIVGCFGNSFVIPKVVDNDTINNGFFFNDIFRTLQPAENGLENIFYTQGGTINASENGIFFHASKEGFLGLKKKPFTQVEARQIAILAMHNRDLLPPAKIKITGKPEERALIFAEIKKLNSLLPENARFVIDPKHSQKFGPAEQDVDFSPVAMESGAPEKDDEMLEHKSDQQIRDEQLAEFTEIVQRSTPEDTLKFGKAIGETWNGAPVLEERIRTTNAPIDAGYTNVRYTNPEQGARIILSIEETDFYKGYQSHIDIKLNPEPERSGTNATFTSAAEDDKPQGETFLHAWRAWLDVVQNHHRKVTITLSAHLHRMSMSAEELNALHLEAVRLCNYLAFSGGTIMPPEASSFTASSTLMSR